MLCIDELKIVHQNQQPFSICSSWLKEIKEYDEKDLTAASLSLNHQMQPTVLIVRLFFALAILKNLWKISTILQQPEHYMLSA